MSNQENRPQASSLTPDRWSDAEAYHRYVGRWSSLVAGEFLDWLSVSKGSRWLEIGCGAGDLTTEILERSDPGAVHAIDLSPAYVEYCRLRITDERASFAPGDAADLEGQPDDIYDAVVAGLVLNFVPQPEAAVAEMARVTKPGGVVAAYVWDYTEKMEFMRHFWNAAVELFPEAAALDEAYRFSICNPEELARLWSAAGLEGIEAAAIDIPTVFSDFDDFWTPFLGGQGSAPTFVSSLTEADRIALRNLIASSLPFHTDGSIHLTARAWAVQGNRPE